MNGERDTPPDAVLVAQARQGSREAFEALVDRHQLDALRTASRLSSTRDEAHDLVQETLLEAFLSLDRLREPERFRSWLLGILLNLGRSRLRRQLRQRSRLGEVDLSETVDSLALDDQPGPQQVAEERELHRTVLAAMDDLSPKQRESVWLFYFAALSLQEIATLLGVSVNTVKVRLHRARHSLRHKLEIHYPELQHRDGKLYGRQSMEKVRIADVIKHQDKTVVMLLSESGDQVLPIWIGEFEGASIVAGVLGFQPPRPLTFDFIASLLAASNTVLEEVRVEALKGSIFYGVAKLRVGDQVHEVDARPSDVLALAARTGCPIYAAGEVMAQAGKPARSGAAVPEDMEQAGELPLPAGQGMQGILEEIKAVLSRTVPKE